MPLLGKQLVLKISLNSVIKLADLSPLILAGLPLLLSFSSDLCRAVRDQLRSITKLRVIVVLLHSEGYYTPTKIFLSFFSLHRWSFKFYLLG